MTLKKDRYAYRVIWSEEDNEYVGLCEAFPSLSWLDGTPEAALLGIRGIVAEVVADMRKTGEKFPEPSAIKPPENPGFPTLQWAGQVAVK